MQDYPRMLYKDGQTCLVHHDEEKAQKLKEGWTLRRNPEPKTADPSGVVGGSLADFNATEAIAFIQAAELDDLDQLEAEENAGKERKTVLAAIETRRVELSAE